MPSLNDTPLRILYRGKLASCNYDCSYCPFAKRKDTRATLARDAADLERFVHWVREYQRPIEILFTPWGEGLVREHYVEALVEMSHIPHVRRVAIQTNLSSNLKWLNRADPATLAFWCTFHPTQITRSKFLARLERVRTAGFRFSVGVVAAHEHFGDIESLRRELLPDEYLWINALSPRPADYYTSSQLDFLSNIDPHFSFNASPPPSLGATCRAGDTSISVDGDGNVKPCHFLGTPLGNLYDGSFFEKRRSAACTNARCDCYIGYIQRTDLPELRPFETGALERILRTSVPHTIFGLAG